MSQRHASGAAARGMTVAVLCAMVGPVALVVARVRMPDNGTRWGLVDGNLDMGAGAQCHGRAHPTPTLGVPVWGVERFGW
jgi:hypothetical protein